MSCEDIKIEIIERIKNIINSSDDKIKMYLDSDITYSNETKKNIKELIMMSKKVHEFIFRDPMKKIYNISFYLAKSIQETIQLRDQKYKLPDDINAINAKIFDNYIKSEIKKYNIHSNDFDFLSILSKYTGSRGTPVDKFLIRIQTHIYKMLASATFGDLRPLLDLIEDNDCIKYNNLKTEASASLAASAASAASAALIVADSPQQSNLDSSDLKPAKAVAFTNLKARLLPQSPEKIVKPPPQIIENHPDSLFRAFKEIIEEASNNYEIENFFDENDPEFQKIYKDLSRTKLSKKEKIKILYLCGFDCLDEEFADNFYIIKDTMFHPRYIKDILINYLKQNQHMIAIGMYDDDIEQEPDTTKQKSNLEILKIDFDDHPDNRFVVTYKEHGKPPEKIPLETQVIYLLHNVMMD